MWRPAVPASPWLGSHRKSHTGTQVSAVCLGGSLGPGVAGNSGLSPQSCWGEGFEVRGTGDMEPSRGPSSCVLRSEAAAGSFWFHPRALGASNFQLCSQSRQGCGVSGGQGSEGRPLMTVIPPVAGKGLGKVTGLPGALDGPASSPSWQRCYCSRSQHWRIAAPRPRAGQGALRAGPASHHELGVQVWKRNGLAEAGPAAFTWI